MTTLVPTSVSGGSSDSNHPSSPETFLRRRSSLIAITKVKVFVAVLLLAGCGSSGATKENAEESLRGIIKENLRNPSVPAGTSLESLACLDGDGREWQCVVKITSDGQTTSFGGTVTCDDSQCLWKPDV